jgi:hypothetical protein
MSMKLIIRSEKVTAGFEGLRLSMPTLQGISILALILGYLFGVGDRGQIFLILILLLTSDRRSSSSPRVGKEQVVGIADDHSQQSDLFKKGSSPIGADGGNIRSSAVTE